MSTLIQIKTEWTKAGKDGRRRWEVWGSKQHPLSSSLLPVVMVIRGFGQDYEIFYLVASALLERTSKSALSVTVSPTPPVYGSEQSVCDPPKTKTC